MSGILHPRRHVVTRAQRADPTSPTVGGDAIEGSRDRAGDREAETGQGMVEYALILVLIAVVSIVVLQTLGHQVSNAFSNLSTNM